MNKSGGLKLTIFLVLIILFLYFANYRPDINLDNRSKNLLTGMVGADSAVEKIKSVDIVPLEITDGELEIVQEDHIEFGQLIGCLINFNADSINVSIYGPQKQNLNDPTIKFFNINSSYANETVFIDFESTPHVVAAGYILETPEFGEWKCFAQSGEKYNISAPLLMINKKPELIKQIPNITLSSNNFIINLNQHFRDPEGQELTFAAVGQRLTKITIDNGNATIKKLGDGTEKIRFRAFDGLVGTLSNEVILKVGTGIEEDTESVCNIIWDCAPWGECLSGTQTRICTDLGYCNNPIGKPVELQSCIPTMSDFQYSDDQQQNVPGKKIAVQIDQRTIPEPLRIVVITLIVILSLGFIGFIAYLILIKLKAKKLNSNLLMNQKSVVENINKPKNDIQIAESKTINIDSLENYVISALRQKMPESKIKKDLLKVGWKQSDINKAFDFAKLKQFIDSKLKLGHSKESIKKILIAKGWKQEAINKAIK